MSTVLPPPHNSLQVSPPPLSANLILNFTPGLANSGKCPSAADQENIKFDFKTKSQNIIWDTSHKMLGEDASNDGPLLMMG